MPHEDRVLQALCSGRPAWEQVSIVAGRQGRAVSVGQLRDCGLSVQQITTATANRLVQRVHRGVRAVGPLPLSPLGDHWAAVLAVGPDSALAGVSGGASFGIRPWRGPVHVAAPSRRRNHRGVVVHTVASLDASMIVRRRGLPLMKPAHVLLDMASRLGDDALTIALNEALSLPVVTIAELEGAMARRRGHDGAARLTRAVAAAVDEPGAGRTHGELEQLVLLLLRGLADLPPFIRNELVELGGGRIAKADVFFPGLGVMIELDSRKWHEQRLAMDSDRRRDQQALAVGIITFRITWRHAVREWDAVSADLVATLAVRSAGGERNRC